MHLSELVSGLSYKLIGFGDIEITSLSCDTSTVKQGCMFFCLKGSQVDGHNLFRKAVGDGARVLVCQKKLDTEVTQIIVENTRAFMARVAKKFYHNAIDKMKLITIVGTNGKTSTTYLLDAIFNSAGYNTGVIGTNGIFINGQRYDSKLTTPDPIELHYWFYQMYLNKVHYVFMEVSAHAIYLKKIEGIEADVAVFTNFSQDHLDFFKTMKKYGDTKKSYFCKQFAKAAVINADDVLGKEILATTDIPAVSYGYDSSADIFAKNFAGDTKGISYQLNLCGDVLDVEYDLQGKFNMYNTLCAAAVGKIFGIKSAKIVEGIKGVKTIDGRNETIMRDDNVRIVVDFAHTPDGIINILSYLKQSTEGNLIVVFGCGGNRDKFKRPLMADAVSRFADFAIITNDNPRFEQPQSIVSDIEAGLTCKYKVILNRSQATEFALSITEAGDTIAILGKGSEKYQEIKGRKYPYSDVDVVHKLLNKYGEK
ncbi:MAG: UDP-N-acetylmuramoyl-L-alanyl-D-glutamate--2,6-diaminopimelate ligase [Corallococcus sp.]|nr:UDP-N-acetylmuramoyl-L-alanyl-D-glutamate--2,6-diaminopimelate ligase [Corallococcus sp.]